MSAAKKARFVKVLLVEFTVGMFSIKRTSLHLQERYEKISHSSGE